MNDGPPFRLRPRNRTSMSGAYPPHNFPSYEFHHLEESGNPFPASTLISKRCSKEHSRVGNRSQLNLRAFLEDFSFETNPSPQFRPQTYVRLFTIIRWKCT